MGESGVARDLACTHEFDERLFHGAHAVGAACGELEAELVIFTLADHVADGVGGYEDFHGGEAADAIGSGDELLRYHCGERERKLLADLGLIGRGE